LVAFCKNLIWKLRFVKLKALVEQEVWLEQSVELQVKVPLVALNSKVEKVEKSPAVRPRPWKLVVKTAAG